MTAQTFRMALLAAAIAGVAPLAASFDDTPSTKQRPSVAQLLKQLDSEDFEDREDAMYDLMERDDALPAARKALRSDSAEVAKRAAQIVEELEKRQIIRRIKNGEIDLAVDQMVAMPDRVTDKAWQAVVDLAQALQKKANKRYRQKVSFPAVRNLSRLAKPEDIAGLDKDRDLTKWRALANQISDRHGIGDSVLICNGTIQCNAQMYRSIIFSTGDITLRQPEGGAASLTDCIVFCDGSIETDNIGNVVLIATGRITIKGAKSDKDVVIENAREALGLLKLSDTQVAGVAVEESRKGVVVKKVMEGKPFGKAGVREGDYLIGLDGKNLPNTQEFRREVRRLALANKEAVLKVKRGKQTMEMKVALTAD
jgi:hypothetical protein